MMRGTGARSGYPAICAGDASLSVRRHGALSSRGAGARLRRPSRSPDAPRTRRRLHHPLRAGAHGLPAPGSCGQRRLGLGDRAGVRRARAVAGGGSRSRPVPAGVRAGAARRPRLARTRARRRGHRDLSRGSDARSDRATTPRATRRGSPSFEARGQAYACVCSRAEIASANVNANAGRGGGDRRNGWRRAPVPRHLPRAWHRPGEHAGAARPHDSGNRRDVPRPPARPAVAGPRLQCGDLLARERHGNWTYQFAVVVDDLEQQWIS